MKQCWYCGRESDKRATHCQECGTAFSEPPNELDFPLPLVRLLWLVLLAIFGWFSLTGFRTTWVGFTLLGLLHESGFALGFVFPLAIMGFLNFSWRRRLGYTAIFALALVVSAEVWAGLEEDFFRERFRLVASGARGRLIFHSNWIAFDPTTGILSGSD